MTGSARKASPLHAPLLVLIVACQIALSHAGTPVVIWCSHNESSDHNSPLKTVHPNPLQKLSSEEFEEILSQLVVTNPTIVVAEELCVEDLRNNKMLSTASNGSRLYYLPCVFEPNASFQKFYSDKQIRTIEDINDDHELNMVLKDTDSSECIALTGKQCRYSQTERIKREDTKEDTNEFKIKTDQILFYSSKSLSFKAPDNPDKNLELPGSKAKASSRKEQNGTLILTIIFSKIEDIEELTLDFFFPVKYMGYYTLDKVNYEIKGSKNGVLSSKRDICFPYNFSYHCSLQTIFSNGPVRLNITDMQVEVDHNNAVFSDAYDCVGFTSIPIWTGIFVTAILALIMIWALTMILDIRTMDRFDDPKGKTITISSAE